jgi:hypothetical protein
VLDSHIASGSVLGEIVMQEKAQEQKPDAENALSEEFYRRHLAKMERGKAELAAEREKQSVEQVKDFALLGLFLILALVSCFFSTWWVRLLILLLSSSLPIYALVYAVRREGRHWRDTMALAEELSVLAKAAWEVERVAEQALRWTDDAIEAAQEIGQGADDAQRVAEKCLGVAQTATEAAKQAVGLAQGAIEAAKERVEIIHNLFEVIQRTTGAPIPEWLAKEELEDYRDAVTKLSESEELLRERLQSLLVQIENLERNQMLIEERMTESVLPSERPLQLIKELRETKKELEDRKRQLDKLRGKLG